MSIWSNLIPGRSFITSYFNIPYIGSVSCYRTIFNPLFNAYIHYLHSQVSECYIKPRFWACMSDEFSWPLTPHRTYIFACTLVLSIRCPSSSCSATSRTGKSAGIIRRGVDPGITEYLEKSETPHFFRRKSSSVSRRPFTTWCGARSIARIASENIVYSRVSVLKDQEG